MIEFEINTNKKQIDFEVTQGIPKYVPANFQSKTVIPTTEQQIVRADSGYDGLEQVTVEKINLSNKTITENGTYNAETDNLNGYSSVEVNVQPTLQEKSVTITENGTTEVVADHGYDGLSKVSIEANIKDNSLLNVIKGMNSYQTTNYPFELTADMFGDGEYLRHGFIRDNFNLTKVTFPEHIKRTSQYCFYNCKNLKSVDMNSIEYIEAYTFQDCTSLTSIDAPNATYVNFDAFRKCTALTDVNIPNAKISNDYVFYDCVNLRNINFSKETTTVGNYIFYNCQNLTSIDLPNVVEIGSNAFNTCINLQNITIPKVTKLGAYAFSSCKSLTRVDISFVTNIGNSAFRNASGLVNVKLSSATTIGTYVFYNCTALQVVDFRSATQVPTLSNINAFNSVPTSCKFIIPDSLYDSWIVATNWVSYANKIIKASEYTEA